MGEIAEKLNCSIHSVCYFMRRHNLKRRSLVEISRRRFEAKLPSFKLKKKLSLKDERLKIIGTVIYWGEGAKSDKTNVVDLANSDPKMVSIFIKFLRQICGVDESKLRILLYCYSNQKPLDLIKFWSKITKVSPKQFSKPYVREDFLPEKEGKMPHGLIHVRYGDKKLLMKIKEWIEDCKK